MKKDSKNANEDANIDLKKKVSKKADRIVGEKRTKKSEAPMQGGDEQKVQDFERTVFGKLTNKERKRGKLALWAIGMLLWVGVALLASQLLVGVIMVAFLGDDVLLPVWSTIYSALVYALALFLVIFVPWRLLKLKTTRDELGLSGLPRWSDLGLSVVGVVVYFVLAVIVTGVFMALLPNLNWDQAQDVGFENLTFWWDRALAFVALVVVAPVAEEIIFRGWLYGKFRAKMPAWVSIILVSALFGLMHGQWNVAVNVFCLSVVLCLLREITGTIWSGMVVHMLKNGIAFYLLFVSPIYLMQ